jgi:hypothetical protein
MKINTLLIAILVAAPSLLADTVTLTMTQSLGPGPAVTYVEVVSPGPTPTSPATVHESSNPCPSLSSVGCSFGIYGVALPILNLPSGSQVTNATLQVAFTPKVSDSGLFVVSSVPVDPTQPTGGIANAGSHFESLLDATNTAVGTTSVNFGHADLGGNPSLMSFDYTVPTETAVQTASSLMPINIDLNFQYGFGTAFSAGAASNTITTFNENFSLLSSPVVTTLAVDYAPGPAPVPEPSSWTLALTGAFIFLWINLWLRVRAAKT